jgi:hypothetical protein
VPLSVLLLNQNQESNHHTDYHHSYVISHLVTPTGTTGYVQVCDGFANKKIKELISELEEIHYDKHEAEWRDGKYTVGDRRVLLAEWTLQAYNRLHSEFGHLIIKAFEQVGLSLNPDGSEDWKLKIRDLPGTNLYTIPLNDLANCVVL